ncbi:hypothetical protein POM88_033013 [Heracleum sosnowskyi]|uniref:Uncharacterized protein n=1 Tax=Heracleum sosnowskyi TaxID=360622 RepID=A0AAD8I1A9_9APIA|nr:hypothetical protein POM88_033013 [Heracleum sosnowskyi]
MGISANAFALLADQQGEASTIVELKTTEMKKIAEKKQKIAEKNKKKKAKKNKKQKESDGETSLDSVVTQEDKAVNNHGNENEEKVCSKSAVLANVELREKELRERVHAIQKEREKEEAERKERALIREAERKERHEQWLARELEREKQKAEREERWRAREAERMEREERWLAKETERLERQERQLAREVERNERLLAREAESKQRRLAREEERKKEMSTKTLREYEQQAYEKQMAEKASLTVPETPLREATLDTMQKSKDETVKKDNNTKKHWTVRKTMNIHEFVKLQTEREGQHGQDRSLGEDSTKNTNAILTPDLSDASFPVLGKVTKLLNLF